jgi:membrane protein YdbS with pleckstrin-like domain
MYAVSALLPIWIFISFISWAISTDSADNYPGNFFRAFYWITGILLVIFIIAYPLIGMYFRSIIYEIVDDEIHVFRGIITKTRKIVPYRTITNLDVKQGPYDRLLNLGTIEIQTAGYSAQKTGPEERLDGLPASEVEQIQTYLLNKVRKVKGSAGAISHDAEGEVGDDEDVLRAILHEVRELRKNLKD